MTASDLTLIQAVRDYLNKGNNFATAEETLLGKLITRFSVVVYRMTARRALNQVLTLTDLYSGSGSRKQYVKDYPIQSVTSVSIGGVAVAQSPDGYAAGWTFGANYIVMLPGTYTGLVPWGLYGGIFPRIPRSVQIVYTAGYDASHGDDLNIMGDAYYNNAPADLGEAVTETVALTFKKRQWVGIASETSLDGKLLTFGRWEMTDEAKRTITNYKRLPVLV